MNEKVAKKVGEAHAFAQGIQNLVREHPDVSSIIFGDKKDNLSPVAEKQKDKLEIVAEKYDMGKVVTEKSLKTVDKISTMANTYVGDEWTNPTEVLEWISFFLGAALVHWQLILGSAKAMEDDDFAAITEEGVHFYAELIATIRNRAEQVGRDRVTE